MRGLESGDDLQGHVDRVAWRQRPRGAHAVLERPRVQEFHGDHWNRFHLAGREHRHDIAVTHGGGELALAQETLAHFRGVEALPEHLQRDAPASVRLFRLIHCTHAAFAEEPEDTKAAEVEGLLDGAIRPQALSGHGQRSAGKLAGETQLQQALGTNAAGISRAERRVAFEAVRWSRHGCSALPNEVIRERYTFLHSASMR
jgi:hypothetical protein